MERIQEPAKEPSRDRLLRAAGYPAVIPGQEAPLLAGWNDYFMLNIVDALAAFGRNERVMQVLRWIARERWPDERVPVRAAEHLTRFGDVDSRRHLAHLATYRGSEATADDLVRLRDAAELRRIALSSKVKALVRATAAEHLARLGARSDAARVLIELARTSDGVTRLRAARWSLPHLGQATHANVQRT